MSSDAPVAGVDLGGTNMQVGVLAATDGSRAIAGRTALKTEAAGGLDRVVANLVGGVRDACAKAGVEVSDLASIGVAACGAIDMPRGVVIDAQNLGWKNVPLRARLEEELGRPVVLDNDVNAATWGEYHLGAGDGRGDALGIWIGTGVGGGFVVEGQLVHGDLFTAGEIGHTVVMPDGPPGRRTVEDLCSRTGLRAIVGHRLADHPESMINELTGGHMEQLGTEAIARAYAVGDRLMVEVVDRSAEVLGVAIANCVTLLALGTVFVGGGITEALGGPYLERIRASFDSAVFPESNRACRLVMTELAADAGLLGAALLARGDAGGRGQAVMSD